jgi:uncharacterized protein
MDKKVQLALAPSQAADFDYVKLAAIQASGLQAHTVQGVSIAKRSIDARGRQVRIQLLCTVHTQAIAPINTNFKTYTDVSNAPSAIIIGFGPAGIFAALKLISLGIKPIVIERGKNVRDRRRDLAILNKQGILNEQSNYCFGEGGAGTYSDGKLYTRSGKRGSIEDVLKTFVQFGATPDIMVDAHPHIGTNKLPQIIAAMREQILASGGEVHFNTQLTSFKIENNIIKGINTNQGFFEAAQVILATGHSARDIYTLLNDANIYIEPKDLAIGVRVEHPQQFVDTVQYSCNTRDVFLPPASYSLVEQINGRGVFSFCMCPGGIIATASTEQNALVVNGWSPSKRNNAFANSGVVVAIGQKDMGYFQKYGALSSMYFQKKIEEAAFYEGGGKYQAPAQRITDFVKSRASTSVPACSYVPGITPAHLGNVLEPIIHSSLRAGLKAFDNKMKGYMQEQAVVVATESRTSSPVRIPRDAYTLEHVHIKGLYPCGEGAGYAGGIVSAAIDGEKVAFAVYQKVMA